MSGLFVFNFKSINKEFREACVAKVTQLVMAGGGIKGLANAPAFHLLNDAGILDGIDNCIGSSVGGLNAAALALGNNPDEIEQLLRSGGDGLLDLFSSSPVFASATRAAGRIIKHLVKEQSAAKGYALYEKAQSSVAQKLGNPNATFSDLSKKMGETSESGGKFRNLELTVTVSDPRGSYQIVCSPQTTPNMPIALAMRMTAGLPPVFPVVKILPEDLKKYTQGATEPLVKYDRGKSFPPYDAKVFFSLDAEKKQDYIEAINNEIITHGELNCSDGGVVDNLPIYLAVNKKDGTVENTMGFYFEEPFKKVLREKHQDMYKEGVDIDQSLEKVFLEKSSPEDFIRTVYFDYIAKPRTPPSHRAALLQKNNLLCFDSDDISSADFELETDKHMTHEEKKAYLLRAGYSAGEEYLALNTSSEIWAARKSFEDLYPGTPESPLCIDTQIEVAKHQVKTWENIFSDLSQEIIMPKYYQDDLKDFHVLVHQAQKNQKRHIKQEVEIQDKLNRIQDFSEKNIVEIIQAKKDCRRNLQAAVDSLNQIQRLNYALVTKFKPYKKILVKHNPELATKFDEIVELKKSTTLLNDLLSTTRDKSVMVQTERKRSNLDKVGSKLSHGLSAILSHDPPILFKEQVPLRPKSHAPKLHHLYESRLKKNEEIISPILEAKDLSIKKLIKQANQYKNVTKIDVLPKTDSHAEVVLSFQSKKVNNPIIKVHVKEGENNTKFSMNQLSKNAHENKDIQKAVQSICEIAIFSAKPNAKFMLPSNLSEENKQMVSMALNNALKKAMEVDPPKFSKGKEPILPDQNLIQNRNTIKKDI